jgi:hypothetical protein
MRFAGAILAIVASHLAGPGVARADEPPTEIPGALPPPAPPPPSATLPTAPTPAVAAPKPVTTRAEAAPAPEPTTGAADAALSRIIDRPHTVAELEAGIIVLPTAPISKAQSGGDTPFGTIGRGDATVQTGLHVLYRWDRSWAAGAGALFAPSPTSDSAGGIRGLARTHSRSYFFIGGEGRFIPLHYRFLEAWVGVSVGGVVIADRFSTDAGDKVAPILGTQQSTVRTEGFAFGAQFGGTYFLSENWIAGLNFRIYDWILPDTRRCSSIGDCATLTGAVEALELGLTLGYRLPL